MLMMPVYMLHSMQVKFQIRCKVSLARLEVDWHIVGKSRNSILPVNLHLKWQMLPRIGPKV